MSDRIEPGPDSVRNWFAKPAEERTDPLARKDGLEAFVMMLAESQNRVRVVCQGVDTGCGWIGTRKGGYVFGADKPCPRCGSGVVVERYVGEPSEVRVEGVR